MNAIRFEMKDKILNDVNNFSPKLLEIYQKGCLNKTQKESRLLDYESDIWGWGKLICVELFAVATL